MVMPVETWTTKQRKNCENLYVCPSKRNGIHGKFNKIAFGCKFCRICHLGRLFAIIIDVLLVGSLLSFSNVTENFIGFTFELDRLMSMYTMSVNVDSNLLSIEPRHEKTCLRGLTRKDSNRPAQLMRLDRVLKLWI